MESVDEEVTGDVTRKRVGIRLPRHATPQSVEQRWAHELEALAPIADIVEIHADTPAEFAAARRRPGRHHHLLGPPHRPGDHRRL